MKSILINVLIAVALTIYIGVFEWSTPANTLEFNRSLFNFDPSDILSINLKANQSEINIDHANNVWTISKPLPTKANQELLQSIATQIPRLPRAFSIGKKEQKPLSEYGLDKPLLTLEIKTKSRQSVKIESHILHFGHLTPSKSEVYTKLDKEDLIFLIPSPVYNILSKHWDSFRNRKLIEVDLFDLASISFKENDRLWSIESKNQSWEITKPESWPIEDHSIKDILNQLDQLLVNRFVENNLSNKEEYGLKTPLIEINFRDNKNNVSTLYIGHTRAGTTFVQNTAENFIYGVESPNLFAAIPNIDLLRSSRLIQLRKHEIIEMDYKNQHERILFQKNIKQEWMVNGTNYPLDQNTVNRLNDFISISVPEYFLDESITIPEDAFQEKNVIMINIMDIKGKKEKLSIGASAKLWAIPSRLKVFNTEKIARSYAVSKQIDQKDVVQLSNYHFAKYKDFTQVFLLNDNLLKLTQKPKVFFQPLQLPELDLEAIYTIRKVQNNQEFIYQRFGSNLNWSQIKPTEKELAHKNMVVLIFHICQIEVSEWVKEDFTEKEFESYGLDKPSLTLEATFNFTKINPNSDLKNGKYKIIISPKEDGDTHYAALYFSKNNEPLILLPKLMKLSKKVVARLNADPTQN